MRQNHPAAAVSSQTQFIEGVSVPVKGHQVVRFRNVGALLTVDLNVDQPKTTRLEQGSTNATAQSQKPIHLPLRVICLQETQVCFPFVTDHLAASETSNRDNHRGSAEIVRFLLVVGAGLCDTGKHAMIKRVDQT
jgi:hypothetical protein